MVRRVARIAACLGGGVALALAGAPGSAAAAAPAGFPDPGFGSGGQAPAPFGTAARGAALALGPDGSITVAGDVRGSGGEAALVARYTSAGALDPSFAGGGSRIDRFGAAVGAGSAQRADAVAVAPDGSAVVAGIAGTQVMVARYRPDGELDGLFGAGGVVLRDLSDGAGMPPGSGLAAVALTPAGQIVVAGSVGVPNGDSYDESEPGEQIVVGRLSDRGVPDSAFGTGGFVRLQLGARSARRPARSRATALVLGPDGSAVVAGRSSGPDGADRALLARLTPSGRLDPSFGRAGRTVVQLGRASAARRAASSLHALAARADGALLAAGRGTDVAGNGQVVLARFTAAGALDAGFGRGGVVRTQVNAWAKGEPPESVARAIASTADGSVLVTGASYRGSGFTLRTTGAGRLDCAYGTLGTGAGFAAVPNGRTGDPATDGLFGVLAQPDGNYVAAGRLAGGGLLLGRVVGGPGAGAQAPARTAHVRTLGARYLGGGRAVVFGAVGADCSSATVRFVASPVGRGGGRAITTRYARVSGAFGPQVVCAVVRGLRPGRSYRVRIGSRQAPRTIGVTRVLRAVPTGRRALPQEGCAQPAVTRG
jgi:uncharacterized delta-60 repeat protein